MTIEQKMDAKELFGVFNIEEDDGNFVLNINQEREERAEEILNKQV